MCYSYGTDNKCDINRMTLELVICVCCMLEHSLCHSKHQQLNTVVTGRDEDVVDDVDETIRVISDIKKVNVAVCPV